MPLLEDNILFYFWRAIVVFTIGFVLSACATDTIENISPTDKLGKDHAIIVGRVVTVFDNLQLKVHEANGILPVANIFIEPSDKNNNQYEKVFAMEVNSGYLHYTSMQIYPLQANLFGGINAKYIYAPPGMITYIGDAYVGMGSKNNTAVAAGKIVFEKEAALNDVKAKFPWLLEKYPLNNNEDRKTLSEIAKQTTP